MNAIRFLEQEHEKAKAAFDKLIAAAPADRGRMWKALQPELKAHEEIEEACLYGPIEEEGVDDEKLNAWVSDLHEEQVGEVEELIEQTEQLDPKEPSWLATVRKIHDALAGHIRQEEGEIFPRIGKVWGAERLEKAGVQMSDMQGKVARR
jgi:iron-sulfur cluster repair protein YtfE (RIC family)